MMVRTKHHNKGKSPGHEKGLPEGAHQRKEEIPAVLNQLNTCLTVKPSELPIHRTMLGVISSTAKTERTGIISSKLLASIKKKVLVMNCKLFRKFMRSLGVENG
jgi:hypothetical protein